MGNLPYATTCRGKAHYRRIFYPFASPRRLNDGVARKGQAKSADHLPDTNS
jgi:hypothetical protein